MLNIIIKSEHYFHKHDQTVISYYFQQKNIPRYFSDISSNEEVWTSRRKIFNPAFHSFELKHYIPIMNTHASKLVEKIASQKSQESNEICIKNMTDLLSETTLAILLETLFDSQEGDIDPQFHSYAARVDEFMCGRISSPWKFLKFLYRWTNKGTEFEQCKHKFHSAAELCLKKRIELVKTNETKSRGIFDDLIRKHFYQPEVVTMKDMVDEVRTFIFGGTGTTNWSMTFVLFILGHHIEDQERAYQEIIQAMNSDRDSTETKDINFDIEILSKLKYLECIINEAQRTFPIVNTVGRHVMDDLTIKIDGNATLIPGDSQCIILCENFHKDPRYWTDPDIFNPSRFLNVKGANGSTTGYDPYSFIPFSSGPRNCIGKPFAMLEMRIILVHLVSAYKIRSITPLDTISVNIQGLITRTCDSLSFKFEPRI